MYKLEIEFKDGHKEIIDNVTNYDWDETIHRLGYFKDAQSYSIPIPEIAKFEAVEE